VAEEISSRKIVPPSAALNLPCLSLIAPVNAPLMCPNSSLSSSDSGSAPQLTSTNGFPADCCGGDYPTICDLPVPQGTCTRMVDASRDRLDCSKFLLLGVVPDDLSSP
jgi:hypothetical protein